MQPVSRGRRVAGTALPLFVLLVFLVTSAVCSAATLSGAVRDPQGAAVPRARVLVVGPLGTRTTVTAADGRFRITDLPAATYRVIAEAEGLTSNGTTVTLGVDDDRDLQIALLISPLAESVAVSASQVEVAAADAPATVTVIGREELKARQVDSLGEAIRFVPGLTVSSNGGPGALTSLFPRGGESDYTLLLVDGMRLNTFGGGIDLSQLALENVERIEVVRGPQSAVYGADAIGGVIHVVTRHEGPTRANVLLESGNQATWRGAAGTAGSHGPWSWGGSFEHDESNGFTGVAPATGERVTNDGWWQRQTAGSGGWQPSQDASVRVHIRWQESDRGFPGPYGSNPVGAFTAIDTVSRGRLDNKQAGASGSHAWSGALRSRARQRYALSYSDLDSDFTSPFGPSSFESRRLDARTQTDLILGANSSLTFGVEAQHERAVSTFITGDDNGDLPVGRTTWGYFAELRTSLGASVTMTAGLRADDIRRDALAGNAFVPRPAFPPDHQTSVNPRVTLAWYPWRSQDGRGSTRLHASGSSGIRPPDAYEIAFTDNPSLQPERSRSFEAGVTQSLTMLPVDVQAVYFHNTYDDLIVAVGSPFADASRFRTDNISNARARGLELSSEWRIASGISARAAYTWLDTEVLAIDRSRVAPPPYQVGDPLIRRPRHQGSVQLLVSRGRAGGFVDVGARGRTLDVEPSLGAFGGLFHNGGYLVTNAGASVRTIRGIEIYARGINLFDRHYEEAFGYPAPGRSGIVGVRVAVGR